MQHRFALFIGKIHVRQPHVTLKQRIGHGAVRCMRVFPCPVPGVMIRLRNGAVCRHVGVYQRHVSVIGFGLFVDQGKHAFTARGTHHNAVDLLGSLIHVTGKLLRHIEKRHDDVNRKHRAVNAEVPRVADQEYPARYGNQHVQNIADIADDRPQHVGISMCLETILTEFVIDTVKILFARLFMAEHLDHLLPVHHLLHIALGCRHRFLLADKELGGAAPSPAGNEDHGNHACHQHQGQPHAVIHHNTEHGKQNDCGV